jgi:hypothetical protein
MAAAVQETAARLGLVTGRGLATLIRRRFPRWVLLGALALVIVANTFNIAADVDWSEVWHSLVSPSLVGGAGGIAALIAVFGTTLGRFRSGRWSVGIVGVTLAVSLALPLAYLAAR